jgi:hypothetical protein
MAERTWHAGRVVWRELLTADVDAAEAFYARLFGWRFSSMDLGRAPPYPTIVVGGVPVGGFARMTPGARSPASWLSYVSIADVDAALHRVRDFGGSVVTGPVEVRGTARAGVIADPWGATLGLVHAEQGDAPLPGGTPEGTFCWETLVAPEPPGALAFYGEVVGWWTAGPGGEDAPILMAREHPVADVQRAPPGRPGAWITSVAVGALGPARERVAALGGAVSVPELQIPELGRLALVADPQGATFALREGAARE